MKSLKLLLLAIFATTFLACPSDDDTPPETPITIVGTWKLSMVFENGVEEVLDPCEREATLIFGIDGDFSSLNYDDLNGTCELEDTITGTWTRMENTYNLTIEGETFPAIFIFEDSNTFFIDYTDDDYKEVFKRQ